MTLEARRTERVELRPQQLAGRYPDAVCVVSGRPATIFARIRAEDASTTAVSPFVGMSYAMHRSATTESVVVDVPVTLPVWAVVRATHITTILVLGTLVFALSVRLGADWPLGLGLGALVLGLPLLRRYAPSVRYDSRRGMVVLEDLPPAAAADLLRRRGW